MRRAEYVDVSGAGYGEASKRLLSDNQYIPSLYYTGARGAASGGEGFRLPNGRLPSLIFCHLSFGDSRSIHLGMQDIKSPAGLPGGLPFL